MHLCFRSDPIVCFMFKLPPCSVYKATNMFKLQESIVSMVRNVKVIVAGPRSAVGRAPDS